MRQTGLNAVAEQSGARWLQRSGAFFAAVGTAILITPLEHADADQGQSICDVSVTHQAPAGVPSIDSLKVVAQPNESCIIPMREHVKPKGAKVIVAGDDGGIGALYNYGPDLLFVPELGASGKSSLEIIASADGKESAPGELDLVLPYAPPVTYPATIGIAQTSYPKNPADTARVAIGVTNTLDSAGKAAIYSVTASGCGQTYSSSSGPNPVADGSRANLSPSGFDLVPGPYTFNINGGPDGTEETISRTITDAEGNANCAVAVAPVAPAVAAVQPQAAGDNEVGRAAKATDNPTDTHAEAGQTAADSTATPQDKDVAPSSGATAPSSPVTEAASTAASTPLSTVQIVAMKKHDRVSDSQATLRLAGFEIAGIAAISGVVWAIRRRLSTRG